MEQRKINLEEILYDFVYSKTDIRNLKEQIECEKNAMLETCRQILELATENAHSIALPMTETGVLRYLEVDKQSITNTIKQVEY